MATNVSAAATNVIKVGSRFHHIQISDGVVSNYYYNTREEAEKKCDEKNDAIYRREQHEKISQLRRELQRKREIERERERESANRSPSYRKPTKISNELADFVGKPHGSEMARTEVTRVLTAYIRKHKLQDPYNRRRILADNKLSKLLKLQKSDELTYFNLQKHMMSHFAKKCGCV